MRLNPPHSKAVIDVPDDAADRYIEAGYTKVGGESPEPTKKAAKKVAKK